MARTITFTRLLSFQVGLEVPGACEAGRGDEPLLRADSMSHQKMAKGSDELKMNREMHAESNGIICNHAYAA